MTIEEKAKRYDEALKQIKECTPDENGFVTIYPNEIFPDLYESEDERIRKFFINFAEHYVFYNHEGFTKNDAIAWLEKQCEHANFCSKIQVGDKVTRNEDGVLVNLSQLKRVAKKDEKQGEQKHKIQPKFKIGDIIRFKGNETLKGETETHKIVSYDNESYVFDDGTTDLFCEQDLYELVEQNPACGEEVEPQKELAETYLTVFDKKFPILPTLKGKQLADYKNFLNKCQQILGLKYWGLRPLQAKLFEKLSLLWAAWGAEHLKGLGQTDGDTDNEKREWSEEDESLRLRTIGALETCKTGSPTKCVDEQINWLKSLKDRVQPKQEWSEEDEDILNTIINHFEIDLECTKNDDIIKWLKSLRPQSQWKPSEEQMKALEHAINCYSGISPTNTEEVYTLEIMKEQLKNINYGTVY